MSPAAVNVLSGPHRRKTAARTAAPKRTTPWAAAELCDFCGLALTPGWSRFDADDLLHHAPGVPIFLSVGPWAACPRCAPHVRRRAWRPLLDHVTRTQARVGRPLHPTVAAWTLGMWRALEPLLRGERPGEQRPDRVDRWRAQ